MDHANPELETCPEPLYDRIRRLLGRVRVKRQLHRIIYSLGGCSTFCVPPMYPQRKPMIKQP